MQPVPVFGKAARVVAARMLADLFAFVGDAVCDYAQECSASACQTGCADVCGQSVVHAFVLACRYPLTEIDDC